MRYRTNERSFDLHAPAHGVRTRYLIASSPRTGSNMLCRALWLSGLAGAPDQYLNADHMLDFCQRENRPERTLVSYEFWQSMFWVNRIGIEEYLRFMENVRTTPNGVFGLRMHASNFFQDHLLNVSLREILTHFRIIRLVRQDYVAQAISFIVAAKHNAWIDDPEWHAGGSPSIDGHLKYDRQEIDRTAQYLAEMNRFFDTFFRDWPADILTVQFEGLMGRYETEMRRVFDFIGTDQPAQVPTSNTRPQSSRLKDEWRARYESE